MEQYIRIYGKGRAMATIRRKRKLGRPPREDDPAKVLVVLSGRARDWLKAQSIREKRAQSAIVESALALYRERRRTRQ